MAAVSTLPVSDVPTPTREGLAVRESVPAEGRVQGELTTKVLYSLPPPPGEQLYFIIYQGEAPGGQQSTNVQTESHEVRIRNMRSDKRSFSIHKEGFQLEKLTVPDIDWSDSSQISKQIYPCIEQLIKDSTGATRVLLFDSTVRRGSMKNPEVYFRSSKRQPVPRVHVDYTLKTGASRLRELLPEEADSLSKTPFAVIQVWRPLRGPVEDSPLALVDARSVKPDDLMENRIDFPERTGYTYSVKHNPDHQFYYAEGMGVDEAYVFKCYDSRNNTARFTPHSSFHNPNAAANAPERESVEFRAYAFWEDLPPQEIAHGF